LFDETSIEDPSKKYAFVFAQTTMTTPSSSLSSSSLNFKRYLFNCIIPSTVIVYYLLLSLLLLLQSNLFECTVDFNFNSSDKDDALFTSFSRNARDSIKKTRSKESSFHLNQKFINHISYLGNFLILYLFCHDQRFENYPTDPYRPKCPSKFH